MNDNVLCGHPRVDEVFSKVFDLLDEICSEEASLLAQIGGYSLLSDNMVKDAYTTLRMAHAAAARTAARRDKTEMELTERLRERSTKSLKIDGRRQR